MAAPPLLTDTTMGPESLAGGVGPLPACRSAQGVQSRGREVVAAPPLLTDTTMGPESLAGGVGPLPACRSAQGVQSRGREVVAAPPLLTDTTMGPESLAGGVELLPPACCPAQGTQGKGGAGSPPRPKPREEGWKPAEKKGRYWFKNGPTEILMNMVLSIFQCR